MVTVIRNSHMTVWLLLYHISGTLGHNAPLTMTYERTSRVTRYLGIPRLAVAHASRARGCVEEFLELTVSHPSPRDQSHVFYTFGIFGPYFMIPKGTNWDTLGFGLPAYVRTVIRLLIAPTTINNVKSSLPSTAISCQLEPPSHRAPTARTPRRQADLIGITAPIVNRM